MKLVLCSEGFYTPNTVKACIDLCDKPQDKITVAIINEGHSVEQGDKRWVLDNLNDVAKNFPAEIDIVNLLALPIEEIESRIAQKDVIFVVGGNTDYLMKVFNDSGFSKILPKLLETKVYVGSSAGSMVVGRRVSDEAYDRIFGEHGNIGITSYLNLVDFAIKPHLNSKNFPNNRKEVLLEVCKNYVGTLYGLSDDTAIVVDGESISITGSEPIKIIDGKLSNE